MEKSRILLLFLTLFFVMLGFGIIIPNLAYYAKDIGATPHSNRPITVHLFWDAADICPDLG